jgi:hypothetical protein
MLLQFHKKREISLHLNDINTTATRINTVTKAECYLDTLHIFRQRKFYPTGFQTFLFAEAFWPRKIITDTHSSGHVYIGCPEHMYPKLNINILELIVDRYEYIPQAYVTYIASFVFN